MKSKITVRFAELKDAPDLERLTARIFEGLGVDWYSREPEGWLMAFKDNEAVGVVQVSPTRPVGSTEHMVVDEGLTCRERFFVCAKLMRSAYDIMTTAGVDVSTSFVDFKLKTAKKMFKKYLDGKVVSSGNMLLVRK